MQGRAKFKPGNFKFSIALYEKTWFNSARVYGTVWNGLRLFSPPGRLAIDKQTRMCVLGQGKRCTSPESYLFPSKIKVLRLNFLRRHVALSTTGAELAILCLIYESDRCEIPGVAIPGARGLTGGT
jgi:hypothetical protein